MDRAEFVSCRSSFMGSLAVSLLVVACVAALLGFTGLAGAATAFAKTAFLVLVILAALAMVTHGSGSSHDDSRVRHE
jgi:uncharacterized membrane protein YtjA (UPF0391 family)